MNPLRKVKRNWKWFAISTIGLSAALACIIIILLYVKKETSYDRFHSKADNIYRITMDNNMGAASMHAARVSGGWPRRIAEKHPEIQKVARIGKFSRTSPIKINENTFLSEKAFLADSNFFQVFDFKLLSGSREKSFENPKDAYITESVARKYFGHTDVIGKEITLLVQQDYKMFFTVAGVMADFPENSHFHADIIFSDKDFKNEAGWAYTYFLLKPRTNVTQLLSKIQQDIKKDTQAGEPVPIVYLQKITDIHLHSKKTRELEANGDTRSLILLVSGAFIVLLIAISNFLNLNKVQFIANLKSFKVKIISGATKKRLAAAMALESLFISLSSVAVALAVAYYLNTVLHTRLFHSQIPTIAFVIVAFIIFVAALSILPLFTSKINTDVAMKQPHGKLYTFPLLVQYVLAIIAISGTIVLNRQMNFINRHHPESENSAMLVIPYNHHEVVMKYDAFKTELLKSSDIMGVASAMEEPGGDINDAFPFEMEGVPIDKNKPINILAVDAGFFELMNIRPLAGTSEFGTTPSVQWEEKALKLDGLLQANVNNAETEALKREVGDFPKNYILNESALKLLGIKNAKDALGKRIKIDFHWTRVMPEGRVIGVVPDFHYTNMHNEERPLAIFPCKYFSSNFIVKINPARQKEALAVLGNVWKNLNPDFPLQYTFINDSYRKVYTQEYNQTRALSMFAVISIMLSSLGILAMASFNMQRKIKEIGIRKVNGARVDEILLLLNKSFVKWILISFVIAVPVAYYAMHKWLQTFAYKTPLSWWIFALAGLVALAIALLTVSWQSWRAASRNPVEALRYE